MDNYQLVRIDFDEISASGGDLKSPQLTGLRRQGFRVVGTLPVEDRGHFLVFIMEPPTTPTTPTTQAPIPTPTQPIIDNRMLVAGWVCAGLALVCSVLIGMLVRAW